MILTKTYNFYQWLHYEDGLGTGTPCWNGNVSGMEWESLDALAATQPARHSYRYSYDGLDRLTAADHEALLHHEWYGHGIKRYGNRTETHHKVFEFQIMTSLFAKTTNAYKEHIFYTFVMYLIKEIFNKNK